MADWRLDQRTEETPAESDITILSRGTSTFKTTFKKIKDFIIGTTALTTTADTVTGAIEEVKGIADNNTTQLNAIMQENILDNGAFDIWQRGVSSTNLASFGILADRWWNIIADADTKPATITTTRRTLNANEIPGCKYCYRVEWNENSSVLNENFRHMITQMVDEGYSRFVKNGNKITIKFLARTNIANKKIAVNMHEKFLSDTIHNLNGASFEIGTDWTEVTYTWTSQQINDTATTLDDSLAFQIYFAWGNSYAQRFEGVVESYRGAGYMEIANVRVVVNDDEVKNVRIKSFKEELSNCKRYFQKSWSYSYAPGSISGGWSGITCSDNENNKTIVDTTFLEEEMFTNPTITLYSTDGTINCITTKDHLNNATHGVTPSVGVAYQSAKNFKVVHNGNVAGMAYHWAASCDHL